MDFGFSLFRTILPLSALIAFIIGVRWCIRIFGRRRRPPQGVNRCRCGYPLEHLSVPRCPECGRVIGFDATPEELGLTDEHLKRAQAARERRRQQEAGDEGS